MRRGGHGDAGGQGMGLTGGAGLPPPLPLRGGGGGTSPRICCSSLRPAAPIGRSPFAALPFPFPERRPTKVVCLHRRRGAPPQNVPGPSGRILHLHEDAAGPRAERCHRGRGGSCVHSARPSPLPPRITLARLHKSVNGGGGGGGADQHRHPPKVSEGGPRHATIHIRVGAGLRSQKGAWAGAPHTLRTANKS